MRRSGSLRAAIILPRTEGIRQIRVAPKELGHARERVELRNGSCWREVIWGRRDGRSWNLGLGARHVSYAGGIHLTGVNPEEARQRSVKKEPSGQCEIGN